MKRFIVLMLILFTSGVIYGQLKVGIKAGYNASMLTANIDSIKSNFKSGFQIGAFVRIGKRFYLQPEGYYTTQGGVFTSNVSDWEQTITISSIDVPVLVGFHLIEGDFLNLRILAGPAASFVVNKSISEGGTDTGPITSGDLSSVNWSIQAGGGVDLWKFTLDIRYQLGLNDLIKEVETWTFNSKNNVWVISLGFII